MNALSRLWEKFARSKTYRDSFAAAVTKRLVPLQIKVLRRQRGWSQAQLATESGLTQGVISRAEDPEYGNLTVNTLIRIGAGFDCAYIGRFVPFSELARWYARLNSERELEVPAFSDEVAPLNDPVDLLFVDRVSWREPDRRERALYRSTAPRLAMVPRLPPRQSLLRTGTEG